MHSWQVYFLFRHECTNIFIEAFCDCYFYVLHQCNYHFIRAFVAILINFKVFTHMVNIKPVIPKKT